MCLSVYLAGLRSTAFGLRQWHKKELCVTVKCLDFINLLCCGLSQYQSQFNPNNKGAEIQSFTGSNPELEKMKGNCYKDTVECESKTSHFTLQQKNVYFPRVACPFGFFLEFDYRI